MSETWFSNIATDIAGAVPASLNQAVGRFAQSDWLRQNGIDDPVHKLPFPLGDKYSNCLHR